MGYFSTHPYSKLLVFVIPLLICMVGINYYSPSQEKIPEGFGSAILAFEFAQSYEDLEEVFTPLSTEEIKGLDMLNYIDFGFMAVYSAFLFGFFWISHQLEDRRFLRLGLFLALTALIGDVFENIQLLDLTDEYFAHASQGSYQALLANLSFFTWLKWSSLAIAFALMVPMLISRGSGSKIFAILSLIPFLLMIFAAGGNRFFIDKFALSIFIVFFGLIIYCGTYRREVPE